jgi:hypothetical protein
MIKVVNLVSLLIAPLILSVAKQGGTMQAVAYATPSTAFSCWWSPSPSSAASESPNSPWDQRLNP